MAKNKQKTIYEKWASDSKEPNAGLRFHDAPDTGERAEMVGFTDEELKRFLGEEEFKKLKKSSIDEIEEV